MKLEFHQSFYYNISKSISQSVSITGMYGLGVVLKSWCNTPDSRTVLGKLYIYQVYQRYRCASKNQTVLYSQSCSLSDEYPSSPLAKHDYFSWNTKEWLQDEHHHLLEKERQLLIMGVKRNNIRLKIAISALRVRTGRCSLTCLSWAVCTLPLRGNGLNSQREMHGSRRKVSNMNTPTIFKHDMVIDKL